MNGKFGQFKLFLQKKVEQTKLNGNGKFKWGQL